MGFFSTATSSLFNDAPRKNAGWGTLAGAMTAEQRPLGEQQAGGGFFGVGDYFLKKKAEEDKAAADAATAAAAAKAEDDRKAALGLVDFEKYRSDPTAAMGQLLRNEQKVYEDLYIPVENQLMGMTTYANPNLTRQELMDAIGNGSVNRNDSDYSTETQTRWTSGGPIGHRREISYDVTTPNKGYVQGAMDRAYEGQQRNFQRFGMAPTERQQAAIDVNDSLKRSTAVVDAANRIRQKISAQNDQIMMGASTASQARIQ